MPKPSLILRTGPFWVDLLPGVRLQIEPIRRTALAEINAEVFGEDEPEDEAPDEGEAASKVDRRALAFRQVEMVAARHIVDWEGIGDEKGNPVPPSPDAIAMLLEDTRAFNAFQQKVYLPALGVIDEGNG